MIVQYIPRGFSHLK